MDKMERLKNATERAEEMARTKERLSGILETKKSRVDELERKAKDEFDCEVADIPDLVEELDKEAEAALQKAERLLST